MSREPPGYFFMWQADSKSDFDEQRLQRIGADLSATVAVYRRVKCGALRQGVGREKVLTSREDLRAAVL